MRPSGNHDKMVNTVVQGVKVLQNLSRLQPNLLLKHTEGGTKFIERTGQFAEVFKVDRLGGKAGQVWEWQRGGSKLDWLGNKQRIPGKRGIGNTSSRRNISLFENAIDAVHGGYDGWVRVWQTQKTGANSNSHRVRFKEGALPGA